MSPISLLPTHNEGMQCYFPKDTAMKLKRILVPIDFSSGSDAALELATSLARDSGGTLILAHV
ncbi:MAG: universal stress protein, partial [Planctomycetales bacterium]|nr:universal stress protein [Planctomycetales bacterium]